MATIILATWLLRLTISRVSPGAMVQESIGPSTISAPPAMTVNSPSVTT